MTTQPTLTHVPFAQSISAWFIFILAIVVLVFFDLFTSGKNKNHTLTIRQALKWTCFWFFLAIVFGSSLWLYLQQTISIHFATQKTIEFFTGYLLEEALSIDNVFVFILIFSFFKVPKALERHVLLYGILGAIILRLLFITIGVWLVDRFEWLFYLFGLILIYSGIKLMLLTEEKNDLNQNKLLIFLKKHLPLTSDYYGGKFLIKLNHKLYFTPLFLVLCLIEFSDIVFALDSIPAVFGVTRDPFIVFTSNIFAILGLRSLYFLLSNIKNKFIYLKFGIGIILGFIGLKMLLHSWYIIPTSFSLLFISFCLLVSILISLRSKHYHRFM